MVSLEAPIPQQRGIHWHLQNFGLPCNVRRKEERASQGIQSEAEIRAQTRESNKMNG